MTKAKLKFGRVDTQTGFAASNTALFNDLRPARIVREMLQNSMDAAVAAEEPAARVRFRVTMIGSKDVPDIAGYKEAFQEAVKYRKRSPNGLSAPEKQVVNKVTKALNELAKDNHYLLSIMDNGIGLDETRMTAMLGDGASTKSVGEGGSYGVGHFTAVPTSDLRYLLYGGVQSNGRQIAAGCAFLASHLSKRGLRSPNGYLIRRFGTKGAEKVYDFIEASDIPSSLAADLSWISKEWGHGTAIHIPAFNYFDEDNSLWDIVKRVAAYNFGVALCKGTLVVEVDEGDVYVYDEGGPRIRRLDKATIEGVLEEDVDRQRAARKDSFFAGLRPSGQNAHSIYLSVNDGEGHIVNTELGKASIFLLVNPPMGRTRVDLFRNGMWITDSIPNLGRPDFANCQPFHAVVVPEDGSELHHLVREAEGPMHNELSLKRLDEKAKKDKFRSATKAIAQWIREHVPELGSEEYTPDDFLVVETGGDAAGGGTRSFSMYGTPVVVRRASLRERIFQPGKETVEHEGEGREKGDQLGRPASKRESASRPLSFQSTVVPDGTGRHVVSLRCAEVVDEIFLSLRLHENVDATCDRIWPDETVRIRHFSIDAREGAPNAIRSHDGLQVRLRGLVAGKTYRMIVEHDAPDVAGDLNESSALQVVLHRPQIEMDESPSDG